MDRSNEQTSYRPKLNFTDWLKENKDKVNGLKDAFEQWLDFIGLSHI